ncbi:hypothetical protein P389DRAFT_189520 [Cystobasidium minutum MCA 4210]|uniref:uncharacterized protein n=1 Tax=Cystobasidium minutum MCA 4210 TaxID=1397322 RepID=UPI0034CE34F4|eukprot:jgi/Rhomi1/189520/estExt_fgenesh1_pg.C_4_t10099
MPASIYDLPPETLALILLHAQAHDQHAVATQYSRTHQQHVKPADYQQRQQRHAHLALNSALQLSRTSRAFYDASLAVHYHNIDFTRVKASRKSSLLQQLSQPRYSRYLRKLKVKIALGIVSPGNLSLTQQAVLNHNDAISIIQASELLHKLPYLTSLEVVLVNCLPGSYVSRLPGALETSLRRLSLYLSHLGISSQQLKVLPEENSQDTALEAARAVTATPYFHLDEQLVADAVAALPALRSLTVGEVSYDTLANQSPLLEAISSLGHLKRLDLLDVASISDKWLQRPLSDSLESLNLAWKGPATPSHCEAFINLHKHSLRHLSLASTSSTLDSPSASDTQSVKKRYHLPLLESLVVQADNSEIGTLPYLQRYTTCTQLHLLVIKQATEMTVEDLQLLLLEKKFKALRKLEIGQEGVSGLMGKALIELQTAGRAVGVEVSSL